MGEQAGVLAFGERAGSVRSASANPVWGGMGQQGWTMIPGVGGLSGALELLADIGSPVPQYGGSLLHEVRRTPGHESLAYTGSTNRIGPHTEAPVHDPPPRYVALYCHRQDRLGTGHTLLANALPFLRALSAEQVAVAREHRFEFVHRSTGPEDPEGGCFPLLSTEAGGRVILRFSHNLVFLGDIDGRLDGSGRALELPPGSAMLVEQLVAFFSTALIEVLIPDDGVLVWDNHIVLHSRRAYLDPDRHLTRLWLADAPDDRGAPDHG